MRRKDNQPENYMWDLYPNITDITKAKYRNSNHGEERSVDGLAYEDPDMCSFRLYQDLEKTFFAEASAEIEQITEKYADGSEPATALVIQHKIASLASPVCLSSDYIGPSSTSAYHAKLDDDFVWETILKCRTIGGHMMWPRLPGSINQLKARSGNLYSGISDRMDTAMYELKNYLSGKHTAERYNPGIWAAFGNPITDAWLKSFDESGERFFEAFCDFFKLKGSFVDENYDIVWLAPQKLGKATKEDVKSFFLKNTEAIQRRNDVIMRECKAWKRKG